MPRTSAYLQSAVETNIKNIQVVFTSKWYVNDTTVQVSMTLEIGRLPIVTGGRYTKFVQN